MSGDSGDKREVEPAAAAAAGSGRQKPSQPVNSCLIVSSFCLVSLPLSTEDAAARELSRFYVFIVHGGPST